MEVPQHRAGEDRLHRVRSGDPAAGSLQHRPQDGMAHLAQGTKLLVPVDPLAQVDLSQAVQTDFVQYVDHDAGFHAVSGEERYGTEQFLRRDELAGQRLYEAGQLRIKKVEQRFCHQLGDPTATIRDRFAGLHQGPTVASLDEDDIRLEEQCAEDTDDEMWWEIPGVRVGEHDDVALGHAQAAPHRVTLAGASAKRRHEAVLGVDRGCVFGRDACRAVRRIRVHHQDFVDQRGGVRVQPLDDLEDRTDGLGHVLGGQDHRDGAALVALDRRQHGSVRIAGMVERTLLKPCADGAHGVVSPEVLRCSQDTASLPPPVPAPSAYNESSGRGADGISDNGHLVEKDVAGHSQSVSAGIAS